MKISKIEPQKKNKNRFSIYIDDEYRFGLTADIVFKHDLKAGDEISEADIKDVLGEEEITKIKQRAFRILHHRERSSREMKERLLKIGFDENLVEKVIEDFVADKTLDDERFAQAFVSDYTNLRPKGNRYVVQELKKKGITQDVIDQVIDKRNEKKMVKDYIHKKLSTLNKNKPKERQKLVRRLLSQGFTPDLVFSILQQRQEDE